MRYAQWDGATRVDRVGLLVPASSFEGAEQISITFSVLLQSLGASPGEQIPAQAMVDLDGDGRVEFESNEICNSVITLQAALAQEIRFQEPTLEIRRANVVPVFDSDADFVDTPVYALSRDTKFTDKASTLGYSLARDGVYIELEADVLDTAVQRDTNNVRHVVVDLKSGKTNDTLKVVLRETRANTGHFRSIRPVKLSDTLEGDGEFCPGGKASPQFGDADFETKTKECLLNSEANDDLTVEFTGTVEKVLADAATVDPSGIVFDSLTLQSVPNTEIGLWSEDGIALHPLTDEPLLVKTDVTGRYSLPRLPGLDDYFLRVIPPGDYTFPSAYPPTQFESLRVSDPSYGIDGFDQTTPNTGRFVVSADTSPPVVDIPLDRTVTAALMQVSKNATQTSVARGDVVDYQIELTNRSDSELTGAVLVDEIPPGMRYMGGSTRRDGERIEDPTESNPGTLIFSVGDVGLGQSIEISYRLEVTARAVTGELVNSVIARADSVSGVTIGSAQSQAVVRLEERGVFSNRAALFGKVYVDASCDGIQNKGEWPIAGVRLYMQDGTFVITDEDGLYSLMGLRPGLHVIKVDATTLPEGALLKPLDTRNAADADSRFVELTAGDFHRADFASSCPKTDPEKFLRILKERNATLRGSWVLEDAFRFDPNANSPLPGDERRADANGDIAFGTFSKRSVLDVSSESESALGESASELKTEGVASGREEVTEEASAAKSLEQKPLTNKVTPGRAHRDMVVATERCKFRWSFYGRG